MKGTLLHGHTSPETAYLVNDYPYGFTLRCKIRYWIETAKKGQYKGQQRIASQTTNPKKGDTWNKPKYSTYSDMKVLFVDTEGHVKVDGCVCYNDPTSFKERWQNQMDADQLQCFEAIEKRWQKLSQLTFKVETIGTTTLFG